MYRLQDQIRVRNLTVACARGVDDGALLVQKVNWILAQLREIAFTVIGIKTAQAENGDQIGLKQSPEHETVWYLRPASFIKNNYSVK